VRGLFYGRLYAFVHKKTTDANNILEKHRYFERKIFVVLKGTQRRMIKISGCTDTVFEEAYFILRPSTGQNDMSKSDMIAEANRIIRENALLPDRNEGKSIKISLGLFWLLVTTSVLGVTALLLALAGVL
jgi:hypothetical protein